MSASDRPARKFGPRPARKALGVGVALVVALSVPTEAQGRQDLGTRDATNEAASDLFGRTLDGRNNNLRNPTWGQAGTEYQRNAPARYADGIADPVTGPSPRYTSNRIFNDSHQNLFSENGVTQWGFVWGQFIDHTFGLREIEGEDQPLPFDSDDPLEEFINDFGQIAFVRTPAAPGTGFDTTRQQLNTVSSYIDAFAVYGPTESRLEWLREGPVDGDLATNGAHLLLPDNQLPTVTARGDAANAPSTEIDGRLRANPDHAVVAGDVRLNENMGLQGTHLLFAREHNRIVDALPVWLPERAKFDIARRVVGATQQYITYDEFLPALGVTLDPYRGYKGNVNTSLSNEFAVVGYRGHSMVHGEFESIGRLADYTDEELEAIEAMGVEVEIEGDEVEFIVPLNVAFFNPELLPMLKLDAVMLGLGAEPQYKNDEQIDPQLRSVLFQVPVVDNPECLDGPDLPDCFQGVLDLGAIDIGRGRDHGIPSYNDLREAYGLEPQTAFTDITGEDTDELPSGLSIDDPAIMDFVALFDRDGNLIVEDPDNDGCLTCEDEGDAVEGVRRTTLAARLKAIYDDADEIDPFVGMVSEEHRPGSDFGELQHAIWAQEFERLRDGDRYFYANDPTLSGIRRLFGIDYRRSLSEVIADNTELDAADLGDNVFLDED